ncbi:MAG: A/G-specific adenine glycosylase [Candidatus Paceibacterota bacterium]|jgi:A/G-specific adenine glycosylase
MELSSHAIQNFRRIVYAHYRVHGRSLPWRVRPTPYRVLVSEIMLQQTQVDRVMPFYTSFLHAFPTIRLLARASRRDVLVAWQGLGYNRRGLYLWRCAQIIVSQHKSTVPADPIILAQLPGIGPATAASIAAFAYDAPTVFIETNIRSVFIHSFFPRARRVSDSRLVPLIEQTLDRSCPARWYNALMDYGTFLKKINKNPSRKSAHHVRQKPFAGSDRELRGKILAFVVRVEKVSKKDLVENMPGARKTRILAIAQSLVDEGLFAEKRGHYVV